MAEPKTVPNEASVDDFLCAIPNPQVREDCKQIVQMMQDSTGDPPVMWGSGIIGFGTRRWLYTGGREADWMLIGFAPRKQNIALYIPWNLDRYPDLIENLGAHSCGKWCLYIKRLSDVDVPTLKKLIQTSVQYGRDFPAVH